MIFSRINAKTLLEFYGGNKALAIAKLCKEYSRGLWTKADFDGIYGALVTNFAETSHSFRVVRNIYGTVAQLYDESAHKWSNSYFRFDTVPHTKYWKWCADIDAYISNVSVN